MGDVYIEVAAGNASGGNLGEASNPYHWPDDKAAAETAAGEGGRVLMLDGTYASFLGLGASIDDITWEAVNRHGPLVEFGSGSGLAPSNADGHVKLNKCRATGSFLVRSDASSAQVTVTDCDWEDRPTAFQANRLLKFLKCRFPYGLYFSVGTSTYLQFERCTIYLPTATRLNGNNQTCRVDKCIIAIVTAYNQAGDLDWYGAGTQNWVHNWTGYDTGDSWVDGDTDPQFRDPANGDVRLRPFSPCNGKLVGE